MCILSIIEILSNSYVYLAVNVQRNYAFRRFGESIFITVPPYGNITEGTKVYFGAVFTILRARRKSSASLKFGDSGAAGGGVWQRTALISHKTTIFLDNGGRHWTCR